MKKKVQNTFYHFINKIKNGNGEYVKETTIDQRADKRQSPPMGLQCSEKILHPEVVLSLHLDKIVH